MIFGEVEEELENIQELGVSNPCKGFRMRFFPLREPVFFHHVLRHPGPRNLAKFM